MGLKVAVISNGGLVRCLMNCAALEIQANPTAVHGGTVAARAGPAS